MLPSNYAPHYRHGSIYQQQQKQQQQQQQQQYQTGSNGGYPDESNGNARVTPGSSSHNYGGRTPGSARTPAFERVANSSVISSPSSANYSRSPVFAVNTPNSASSSIRRVKTVRRAVAVRNGKLVIDLEVDERLRNAEFAKYARGEEFSKLRYTCATCDPDDFVNEGYTLRQQLLRRHTEVFIVVTMYNEDQNLFTRTMQAINLNIQHMCNKKSGPFAGPHGWQNVVVCIVSDGRKKVNENVLTILKAMGAYQDGVTVPRFMGKDCQAHVFEYTSQVMIEPNSFNVATTRNNKVAPMQIIFCLKENNQKKINSHRWFFNAFAPLLKPSVCVLIDVGTKPEPEAIYRLWRVFDSNDKVGGCCGEIAVDSNNLIDSMVPIVAAQNFEYKMSNILDKPMESWFGYISVLPGAFSAYRYSAVQGRPLQQYFKGELIHNGTSEANVFAANMYLAEDRILCFELVAKRNESWSLYYERTSRAYTDVPDNFPEFISQRRRWLNGSTFALLHALGNLMQIYSTAHSFFRLFVLTIEFLYSAINFVFSYFGLGNFYITYHLLSQGFSKAASDVRISQRNPIIVPLHYWGIPDDELIREAMVTVVIMLRSVYILSICVTFIAALGNRPQGAKYIYLFAIWLFVLLTTVMLYMMAVALAPQVQILINEGFGGAVKKSANTFLYPMIGAATTYGIYVVSSLLFMEPWHMVFHFWQYLFLIPTYTNVLQIYAYCNISDVSWGTKGDSGASKDAGVQVTTDNNGRAKAEIELPSQHAMDVSHAYRGSLQALEKIRSTRLENEPPKVTSEDYFRQFRTIWLIVWIVLNGALIVVFTAPQVIGVSQAGRDSSALSDYYLTGIFFSVAALSVFRFMGSTGYLITHTFYAPWRSRGKSVN